jgi:hypothetical protein
MATWNHAPVFDATKTWASAEVGDLPGSWVDWNVTGLVRTEAAGAVPQLGWLFKADSETSGISRLGYFHSREHAADPTRRPKLVVEFYDLDLAVPPLTPGLPAPAVVERAEPGSPVFFFMDLSTPGATPIVPLGIILETHNPQLIGVALADATGEAGIRLRVPASASGIPFFLQAAAAGRISNLLSLAFP